MEFHFEIRVLGCREMVFQIETQDWEWMKGVFGVEIVVLERWKVLCENETVFLGSRWMSCEEKHGLLGCWNDIVVLSFNFNVDLIKRE